MLSHPNHMVDGLGAERSNREENRDLTAPEHLRGLRELTEFYIRRSTHRELPGEAMERAKAWVRTLQERGSLPGFNSAAEQLRRAGAPFTLLSAPTAPADLFRLETKLGCPLPAAYQTFLIRFGTAQFLHAWRDTMLTANQIFAYPKAGAPHLIPFCRYHARGTYLIDCDPDTSNQECRVYLQLDGETRLYEEARTFQLWFSRKINVVMEEIVVQLTNTLI